MTIKTLKVSNEEVSNGTSQFEPDEHYLFVSMDSRSRHMYSKAAFLKSFMKTGAIELRSDEIFRMFTNVRY